MRTKALLTAAALALAFAPAAHAQGQSSVTAEVQNPANPEVFGQVDFGGRFSSIDGDEARYQRFRDLRDGVFLDVPVYHRETGDWVLDASFHNVGYRDQRYLFAAEIPGRFGLSVVFDQTPTFFSRDTRTPYRPLPEDSGMFDDTVTILTLPDDAQAAVQAALVAGNAPVYQQLFRNTISGLATGFSSRIRRDTLGFNASYAVNDEVSATVRFLNVRRQGNVPFGASFAFNLAVEVPLPLEQTTNEFGAAVEWATDRGLLRAGWDGSWFQNDVQELVWDSPVRITDRTDPNAYTSGNGTSLGRMALWPTNTLNYFNVAGSYRLPGRSRLNGTLAYGFWDQDEVLLPHTINTAIAPIPLERQSAEAQARTTSATLNYAARPWRNVSLDARYRFYRFDNQTPHFELAQASGSHDEYVRFDQVPEPFTDPDIHKLGPEFFGYTRNNLDVDASYSGLRWSTLRVGFGYLGASEEFRVYEDIGEKTFRVAYDLAGTNWLSFRSQYEYSQRRGNDIVDANVSGPNLAPDVLEAAGEQPGMRHYDIADRDRHRFTLSANANPFTMAGFNAQVFWTDDEYQNPEEPDLNSLGMREFASKGYALGVDVVPRESVDFGVSYAYERYDGSFQSRQSAPGPQFEDPTRNWSLDEEQSAHSLLADVALTKFFPNTDVRLAYDYTSYDGLYLYRLAGAYVPSPAAPGGVAQLPPVTNDVNRFTTDLRYWIRRNLAVGFVYWFEDYQVEDWAFSPDVLSDAARPVDPQQGPLPTVSGVLLNYLYRPYTAHSAWVRLTYVF